ncbi:MAG: hypothetical protein ACYTAQ_12035 [Planctomycetota bacterium]|jgi:hypothetical protein
MRTTYDRHLTHAGAELVISESSAETVVSLYGARGNLKVSTVIIHSGAGLRLQRAFTLIRLGYTPLVNHDDRHGWEDCAYLGVVRVPDTSTGVRRQVEQVLVPYRPVYVSTMDFTDMSEGGATLGRRVVRSMLRRFEALLEHSRRSIRDGFAGPVRDRAIRHTHLAYGQSTARSATILGTLQWPLLLEGSNCGQECLDTIAYTTTHNPPQFLELVDDEEMDVEPLDRDEPLGGRLLRNVRHRADMLERQQHRAQRENEHAAGTARAVELMRNVCGEAAADQFTRDNYIILEHDGYEFTLSPDRMIPCRDPNGKKARLCIHTCGFCCHPVDEIIIAYLNIRHRFGDFMHTANVLGRDRGFQMPPPGERPRLVQTNRGPRAPR